MVVALLLLTLIFLISLFTSRRSGSKSSGRKPSSATSSSMGPAKTTTLSRSSTLSSVGPAKTTTVSVNSTSSTHKPKLNVGQKVAIGLGSSVGGVVVVVLLILFVGVVIVPLVGKIGRILRELSLGPKFRQLYGRTRDGCKSVVKKMVYYLGHAFQSAYKFISIDLKRSVQKQPPAYSQSSVDQKPGAKFELSYPVDNTEKTGEDSYQKAHLRPPQEENMGGFEEDSRYRQKKLPFYRAWFRNRALKEESDVQLDTLSPPDYYTTVHDGSLPSSSV